jgi:hypothetical protein
MLRSLFFVGRDAMHQRVALYARLFSLLKPINISNCVRDGGATGWLTAQRSGLIAMPVAGDLFTNTSPGSEPQHGPSLTALALVRRGLSRQQTSA